MTMTNISIETMKKDDLIALVLANSSEYKKTHLVEMKKDEVLKIAAALSTDTEDTAQVEEQPEDTVSAAQGATDEAENTAPDEVPTEEESAEDAPAAAPDTEDDGLVDGAEDMTPEQLVAAYYDKNAKMVKGGRINKDEFRTTAIAKTVDGLTGTETSAEIRAAVIQTITDLLTHKAMFLPINETEKKMLATLPTMKDFTGTDSKVIGKDWLDMVEATHSIPVSSTRALMVALRKKGFIWITGKKSGEKVPTVHLLDRGIRYLKENNLLPASTEQDASEPVSA